MRCVGSKEMPGVADFNRRLHSQRRYSKFLGLSNPRGSCAHVYGGDEESISVHDRSRVDTVVFAFGEQFAGPVTRRGTIERPTATTRVVLLQPSPTAASL